MESLEGRIQAFLRDHSVLTLASAGPEGPWAAPVFYVQDGWRLYFFSKASSRHIRELGFNGEAAGAVARETFDWREIAGVQLTGRVEEASLLEKAKALELFARKYDFMKGPLAADLWKAGQENRIYKLTIGWIRLIDNGVAFGHKEELRIGAGES